MGLLCVRRREGWRATTTGNDASGAGSAGGVCLLWMMMGWERGRDGERIVLKCVCGCVWCV